MTNQDRESAGTTQNQSGSPVPVAPSARTERPEGVAFDVEKGADLRGMPVGDQHPANPGSAPAHESGNGVGLAVPGDEGDEAEVADLPAK
jgi:hypothetical protein